jgi:hypothetical protein
MRRQDYGQPASYRRFTFDSEFRRSSPVSYARIPERNLKQRNRPIRRFQPTTVRGRDAS